MILWGFLGQVNSIPFFRGYLQLLTRKRWRGNINPFLQGWDLQDVKELIQTLRALTMSSSF